MNSFLSGFFVICVLIHFTSPTLSESDAGAIDNKPHVRPDQTEPDQVLNQNSLQKKTGESDTDKVRNIAHNEERTQQRARNNKPLRSIVMGIYKNYKSTYLGNKTLTEYKQTLRESMKSKQQLQQQNVSLKSDLAETDAPLSAANAYEEEATVTDVSEEIVESTTIATPEVSEFLKAQDQTGIPTQNDPNLPTEHNKAHEEHYHIGPALNMSLDMNSSIVKVNLDGESLKELVTGRWLNDNTDEGRGKKYEMVTRILPLFILPFLIQSAIVPFLVTKLKLLLMKSMLVGKLAIFLLIISAFRNSNKMMQTYEVAPSYWASEPSRRSEMAAAASSMAYNGYRVEGKPTAWIN